MIFFCLLSGIGGDGVFYGWSVICDGVILIVYFYLGNNKVY